MNNYEWENTAPDTEGFYWLYGDPDFGTMGGNYTGVYPLEEKLHIVQINTIGDGLVGVCGGQIIFLQPFNEADRIPGWVGQWMKIEVPRPPGRPVPELLSAAIDMAVTDLEAVEKDAAYRVNMSDWHVPNKTPGDFCEVCFAGSIMAKTLNLSRDEYIEIADMKTYFGPKWQAVFLTLDSLRGKDLLEDALYEWDGVFPDGCPIKYTELVSVYNPPSYTRDPEGFKVFMRELAEKCRTIEKEHTCQSS